MTDWKSPLLETCNPSTKGLYDGCEVAMGYSDFDTEYKAVREGVALSDQSHFGKFRISGPGALELLNQTNLPDIARLAIGKAMTSLMLNEDGTVLADVYIISSGDGYLLLTEGVAPAKIAEHLAAQNVDGAQVEDLTAKFSLIGIDGPYSWELLKKLFGVRILGMRYLEFIENQDFSGTSVHVIRAGKTGEFGYVMIVDAEQASQCWNGLMEAGAEFDCQAVGFETLDVCRMENRFLNLHREGTVATSPLELNCRVMVDHEKDEYLGRDAVESLCETGVSQRIVGIRIEGPRDAIPATGTEVIAEGEPVGQLVNVAFSPSLDSIIGLACLKSDFAFSGIDYQVAGSSAKTVSAPFIFNRSLSVRPQEDSYHAR
jgi:glycine cleavage system aminomethyltransferase T